MEKEELMKELQRYRRWYIRNPHCVICGQDVTEGTPFELTLERGSKRIWIHKECLRKEQKEWLKKKH